MNKGLLICLRRFVDVQGKCAMLSSASTQSHALSVYERRAEWSLCYQKPDWCPSTAGARQTTRGLCNYASRALKVNCDYSRSKLKSILLQVSCCSDVKSSRQKFYPRPRPRAFVLGLCSNLNTRLWPHPCPPAVGACRCVGAGCKCWWNQAIAAGSPTSSPRGWRLNEGSANQNVNGAAVITRPSNLLSLFCLPCLFGTDLLVGLWSDNRLYVSTERLAAHCRPFFAIINSMANLWRWWVTD